MITWKKIVPSLLFIVFALTVLSPVTYASSEFFWESKAKEYHGNLALMLAEVERAAAIPYYLTNRDAQELFEVLKKAGRFQELGLTEGEGLALVNAVYRKMGISPAAHDETASAEMERESQGEEGFPSYRAGTEFEKLDTMLMRWPFDWSNQRKNWAEMIDATANTGVTLYMWVDTPFQEYVAMMYLKKQGVTTEHIVWIVENTDSVWIRDYGPQYIYDNQSDGWGVVDFHYYDSRPNDDDTPVFVASSFDVPRVNRQTKKVVYTEGGNLNHDGLGCVVYSERTYARNEGVAKDTIDERIMSAFQAHEKIVPQDPSLDSTGHVDMFMKIVSANTVLVAEYSPDQKDYQVLEDCAELFMNSVNGAGEPWSVVRIPQPEVYYAFFILPVVRTYTNSIIVNNAVLLPVYNIPSDEEAVALYEQVLPGKTIYPIDASTIIESGGAWHCVTMEFPNPGNPDEIPGEQ
jgi:agmatine deiminase